MDSQYLSDKERTRYDRHIKLPEVGEKGQRKLKAASALIVGMGGLGSASSLYLAAAGLGKIGIVDYDRVELSNLQRQILHGEPRLGEMKVDSALQRINELNSEVVIERYPVEFTLENAPRLVRNYDVIIDGSDNFNARYIMNDVCVNEKKPYVYGAVYGFDGQASVFDARLGPCYRCLFPENPAEKGEVLVKPGVLSPLPGIIGCIQAVEAIKLILGIGESLIGQLLVCSLIETRFLKISVRKRDHCDACGK